VDRVFAIAKHGLLNARAQGVDNRFWRGEIHIGDPHGQNVFVVVIPFGAVAVFAIEYDVEKFIGVCSGLGNCFGWLSHELYSSMNWRIFLS